MRMCTTRISTTIFSRSRADMREDKLQALGKNTTYRMDYAPEVLETFVNKHPDNDYWVQFNCPEFTSVQFQEPWRLPRRLCEYHYEGSGPLDGSEVYRGDRTLHTPWWHQHLSLCQLRTSRHKIRTDGRAAPAQLSGSLRQTDGLPKEGRPFFCLCLKKSDI